MAVWKIDNLLQLNQESAMQIPIPETVQVIQDIKEVYTVRVVYNSQEDKLSLFLGTDKGLRFFLYKQTQ